MKLLRSFPSAIALMLTLTLVAFALAPPIMAHAATTDKAFASQIQPDITLNARHVVATNTTTRAAPEVISRTLDLAANRLARLQLKPALTDAPGLIPKLLANRATGVTTTKCAASFPLLE